MKTIFRNFITTLKRFKLASGLNILGLSVAFTAFTVIMMQVFYDRGFDRGHSKGERTFRVEFSEDGTTFTPSHSRPMIDLMRQAPQVENATLFNYQGVWDVSDQIYLSVQKGGDKTGFREPVASVYWDYMEIFDFDMVEGERLALQTPGRVLIPQSMARRLFGRESALNQRIEMNPGSEEAQTVTVGGVFRDFPQNMTVTNSLYVGIEKDKQGPYDNWWSMGYYNIVTLYSPDTKSDVEQLWLAQLNEVPEVQEFFPIKAIRLVPIPDIYYQADTVWDVFPKGSRTMTAVLVGIALLIIVIASINFVNFSTSLTPLRIKSINTQKVLGSPTSTLRMAMVGESLGIALISFLLSVVFTYFLQFTSFSAFLTAGISLAGNWVVVGITFLTAVVVGLIAGLYPAWYSTSFPPAMVLKGSFGSSTEGRKLRTVLIGFQYIVSIGLIIAAIFMQVQNNYMKGMERGVDLENLALVELSEEMAEKNVQTLRTRLLENPRVKGVSSSYAILGGSDLYSEWTFAHQEDGEKVKMNVLFAAWDMPELLGVQVKEGRDFREGDMTGENRKLIINELAKNKYNLNVGDIFEWTGIEIVGVVDNFNFKSLRNSIEPMAFMVGGNTNERWMYVKTEGDPFESAEFIKNTIASVDPAYPVQIKSYDMVFNELYLKERKTTGLITIFSLLAVVISLVGVFGLVLFETQYRKKEIGVRKVMGATVMEILSMFNKRFTRIVLVCFVLATPLACYGILKWLSTFAYRTPLHWWVFCLSLVIVMIITTLTVTVQSWKAAVANPVDSLKSE